MTRDRLSRLSAGGFRGRCDYPAAGGEFTRALEALMETDEMATENVNPTVDVAAVQAVAEAKIKAEVDAVRAELAAERKSNMIHRVVESVGAGLNESTKTLITKAVRDLEDEAEIRKAAQAFIDGLPQPKPVANIQTLRADVDKRQAALNGLMGVAEGDEKEVAPFRGVQEAYKEWTGDYGLENGLNVVQEVSGQTSSAPSRLAWALPSTADSARLTTRWTLVP